MIHKQWAINFHLAIKHVAVCHKLPALQYNCIVMGDKDPGFGVFMTLSTGIDTSI